MSLGPTSRRLVTAARSGLDPAPDVAARVRAKVALAVGGATSVASTSAGRASVVAGKLLAVIAASAIAVTTWFVVRRGTQPAQPPTISVPMLAGSEEPGVEPHFSSAMHAEAAPPAVKSAPVPAQIAPPVAVTPATLAREVALLDAATAALEDDPAASLATLEIFARETFGRGQLAEDAVALEIEARCRTHQIVQDLLAQFDRRWPHSVQRARITERCSDPVNLQPRSIEPANR